MSRRRSPRRPATPAPRAVNFRLGGRRPWFAGLASAAATVALSIVVLFLLALAAYRSPGPRGAGPGGTTVILRHGAGLSEIASTLERAHAVRSAPLFLAAAQLTGAARRLKPGEYLIPSRASLASVIGRIRRGEIVHHRITIPEGLAALQVVDLLRRDDVLTGDVTVPPEGSVLPETYDVVRGDTRAAVLQRMMDARDKLLAELWTHRRPGLPYTGAEQAVTLASIVEKETAKASERPRVAAVYLNRLRTGMNLDADPTLIYGVTQGLPLGRGLTLSELQTPGPYNTYVSPGLPPTPIANPGRASLAAVMDPPATNDLYFVADGRGGHVFAATLDEQSKNVARWRRLEQARKSETTATTTTVREHR